jgi:hypothetical protein
MSKCQKNKYFIGSCTGSKTENKAFQQDFAKLMAARDAQDSQIQSVVTDTKAIVPFKDPKESKGSKGSKDSKESKGFTPADIDIVLKGDFDA